MRVGLFIPCYVDQFFPNVGMATVELLERHGVEVEFPVEQTCCGQPMANTGLMDLVTPLAQQFIRTFEGFDYIVCPSGSCTSMVRHHYESCLSHSELSAAQRTYELCEFLVDVVGVTAPNGRFPYQIGLHQSCHGLRELRLGQSSERVGEPFSKVLGLLESLDGVRFSELQRPDECCGFGGTFAVSEEAVSCMMGQDRVNDHQQAGTEVLAANDMSCLMHMDGLIRRQGLSMRIMHVAEILVEAARSSENAAPAS